MKSLQNEQIASFALDTRYDQLDSESVDLLKRHLLDSLGSLLHAIGKPPLLKLKAQLSDLQQQKNFNMLSLPLDRAAQYYTALIRYPDFMDNYLGKEATCHPSDNIGSLLAVALHHSLSGKDFLTAMAVAYEIECRLVEEIPVMKEGIDHTLFLSYSIVASAGRLLSLQKKQLAHALGIAGSSISPMVTSRASYTYEWKGMASSMEAMICMNILKLAQHNMTGPIALFEGPKGFAEIFGMKLKYSWKKEDFSLLKKCCLKSYNAEVHTQPAIEAALELRKMYNISPDEIRRVDVTTFLTAYHITGSGAYGDRKDVESKEQADHSMFYVVAVALLDGQVYPEQFSSERIRKKDVQSLLKKINVRTKSPIHKPVMVAGLLDPYTQAYPEKVKTSVVIKLKNGTSYTKEKDDFAGFHTRPLSWKKVIEKFNTLSSEVIDKQEQDRMIDLVQQLEKYPIKRLLNHRLL